MDTRATIVRAIIDAGALAVIRLRDTERMLRVIDALVEGGLRGLEITMTVPDALSMIEAVARSMGDAILLGVGSVLDADTARQAVDAGARFVVSPVFKHDIIEAAHARDVPALPGALTPTEIQTAHEAGADIVKVFPADVVGMPFVKAVLAPMPHLRLMPTGGVSLSNAGDWLRAGACAVGIGSALLDAKAISAGDYGALTRNARTLMSSIEQARTPI